MTFKHEGKIYKLVPDDTSNPDVCGGCSFKNNADACAASCANKPDCIDGYPMSHYEEVPASESA